MKAFPEICLVTETWPPEINGVAMTLSRLVDGLKKRGHSIQVVRPRQRKGETESNQEHLLVPGAPIPGYHGLRFGFPVRKRLLKHWRESRPNLIHIATEGPLGWAALRAAHELKIPVISSFHTQFHHYCGHYGMSWLRRGVSGYLRHFHNRSLHTLVPNESLRDLLENDGYRNVGVLGRGIDTALFNPVRRSLDLRLSFGSDADSLVALHVGRLAPEKNLNTVVLAFEALRLEHPNARMVWVGDGPQLIRLKKKHPDHIFVGAKVGEELAAHYASADVFLFASQTETFGNVTLEAMASGLAVVAYRYAAAEQFIRHQHNGLTADFGDQASFCQLAASLGKNPSIVKQMGEHARLDIQPIGWEHVLEQFTRAMTQAIDQGMPLE